jgi:hypothetical protein
VREMKSSVWGVALILIGTMLLVERLGHVHFLFRSWWPLFLWVLAIIRVIERRYGSALSFLLLGFVFLGCTNGWYGMSYRNSWPLLLVAAGAGMVVRAITNERSYGEIFRRVDHE